MKDTSGSCRIEGELITDEDINKWIRGVGLSFRKSCEDAWIECGCPPQEFEYPTTDENGKIKLKKIMCFYDKNGNPINREE